MSEQLIRPLYISGVDANGFFKINSVISALTLIMAGGGGGKNCAWWTVPLAHDFVNLNLKGEKQKKGELLFA